MREMGGQSNAFTLEDYDVHDLLDEARALEAGELNEPPLETDD